MSGQDHRAATVERLLAERLARKKGPPAGPAAAARPPAVTGRGPLSFTQERLWFLDRMGNLGPAYTIALVIGLEGRLELAALRAALAEIVRRHGTLRTRFAVEDGQPVQVVEAPGVLRLPLVDLQALAGAGEAAVGGVARQLTDRWLRRGFRLEQGHLIRFLLLRLGPTGHRLVVPMHHIVSDGWSGGVFLRELGALYSSFLAGEPSPLPEPPRQFFELAREEREALRGERLAEELAFWRQELEGAPGLLELPTDRPRPSIRGYAGATLRWLPAAALGAAIEAFARSRRATPFMVLLAGFATVLARWSGQRDLALGSPIANRLGLEAEPLIGYFANTLVIRVRLDGEPTFEALVERVRATALAAYPHQSLPFEKLVGELNPRRSLSHNPLFQVMLTLQSAPLERPQLPGLAIDLLPGSVGTSQVDLELSARLVRGTLAGHLIFSTELFDATTVRRLLGHLESLLAAGVAGPETPVWALPLAGPAERAQILAEWNDTERSWPGDGGEAGLHERIARQVEATPEAVAVTCEDEAFSYAGLASRARGLARHLAGLGVGPDERVGIAVERSLEMMVGLLGILEAGAAYVPIDPSYPRERQAFMVADSGVRVLLTQARLAATLPLPEGRGVTVIALDRPQALAGHAAATLPQVGGDSLAYVIYTSGSTGRPKGAMICHRAIVNRLLWMQRAYGIGPGDRVLQKTPISFDVSVWELFWPLLTGATLVVARPGGHQDAAYLVRTIAERQVTTLHFVPSMLQVFVEEGALSGCRSIRRLIASGEALPSALVARCQQRLPAAGLFNLYGPTEAAVDVTAWPCGPEEARRPVPIGRPIDNLEILLLDRRGLAVPIGVPAELAIGGVGLARGYHGRPALTAERFVPDGCSGRPGARLYRTGDLARWRADGAIEYLGRLDHQVKIRGFRIELGEIEAALACHPGVREVVVTARSDLGRGGAGGQRLVAYWVGLQHSLLIILLCRPYSVITRRA